MAGLWRCSNCGEGGTAKAPAPAWQWDGLDRLHHCQSADPAASPGLHPCRWFGDGTGYPEKQPYLSTKQAESEADALRAALRKLASYAATCSVENTPEWMAGLVERLNEGLAAIGEADRVKLLQLRNHDPEIMVVRAGEVPSC